MKSRFTGNLTIPKVFWGLAVLAIIIWSQIPSYVVGWDLEVYKNTPISLRAGHDPYVDGIAGQRIYHVQPSHPPGTPTPFMYVYSPITLSLLRVIGHLPFALSAAIYWLLNAAGLIAALWIVTQLIETEEWASGARSCEWSQLMDRGGVPEWY